MWYTTEATCLITYYKVIHIFKMHYVTLQQNLFKDLPRVTVYLDDILVMGRSQAEHIAYLKETLKRLNGGKHSAQKRISAPEVEYLGHF